MSSNETGFQNFNASNFDPNSLANATSSVIMFGAALDISPSIEDYEDNMNMAMSDVFMHELKNSHRKDDIVISCATFNEDVQHRFGFMPIINLQNDSLNIKASGHGTAIYDAMLQVLENTMKYRESLEDQGIDVRSNICLITDGEDNSSNPNSAPKIKDIISNLRKNEAWAKSFTITVIGVGGKANYENACKTMGLDPKVCLVEVSTSADAIRKQMGVVSQSVSSSSNAAGPVSF